MNNNNSNSNTPPSGPPNVAEMQSLLGSQQQQNFNNNATLENTPASPTQQRKRGLSKRSPTSPKTDTATNNNALQISVDHYRKSLSLFDEELTFRSYILLQESRDIGKVWQSKCDLIATSAYSTSFYRQQKAMTQMKSMIDVSRAAAKEEGARRMNVALQQEANKRQALELVAEDLERKLHLTSTRELVVTEDLRAKIETLENKIRADRQLHSTGVQEVKLSANRALAEKAIAQSDVRDAKEKVDQVYVKLGEIVRQNRAEFDRFVNEDVVSSLVVSEEERCRNEIWGAEWEEFSFISKFVAILSQVEMERKNEKREALARLAEKVQDTLEKSMLELKNSARSIPSHHSHQDVIANAVADEDDHNNQQLTNTLTKWLKTKIEFPLLAKLQCDTNDIENLRNTVIQLAQTSLEQEQLLLHLQDATSQSMGSFVKRCNTADAQIKHSKEFMERREKHRQILFQQSLEDLYKEAEMRLPDRVYQQRLISQEQVARLEVENEFFSAIFADEVLNKTILGRIFADEVLKKENALIDLKKKMEIDLEMMASKAKNLMTHEKSTQVIESLQGGLQTPRITTFSDQVQICVAATAEDEENVDDDDDQNEQDAEEHEEELIGDDDDNEDGEKELEIDEEVDTNAAPETNRRRRTKLREQLLATMREELHLATIRADLAERKLSVVIQGQLRRARQAMESESNVNNINATSITTPSLTSQPVGHTNNHHMNIRNNNNNNNNARSFSFNGSILSGEKSDISSICNSDHTHPNNSTTNNNNNNINPNSHSSTSDIHEDDERMIWAKEFERKFLTLQKEKFDLQRRLNEATAQSAMAEERRVAAVDRKLQMYAEMDAMQRKVAEAEARAIDMETTMRRASAAASLQQQKQQRILDKQLLRSNSYINPNGSSSNATSAIALAALMMNQQQQQNQQGSNAVNFSTNNSISNTNINSTGSVAEGGASSTSFENIRNIMNASAARRGSIPSSQQSGFFVNSNESINTLSNHNRNHANDGADDDDIETPQNINLLTPGTDYSNIEFGLLHHNRNNNNNNQHPHYSRPQHDLTQTFSPNSNSHSNSGDVKLSSGGSVDAFMLYDGIGRVDSVSGDGTGTGSRNASTRMSSLHQQQSRSVGTGRPGSRQGTGTGAGGGGGGGSVSSQKYGSLYGGTAGSVPFTLRSATGTNKNQSLLMRVGGASALQKKKGNLGGRVGAGSSKGLGRVGSMLRMAQQQQRDNNNNGDRSVSQDRGGESGGGSGGHQTPTSRRSGGRPTNNNNTNHSENNSSGTPTARGSSTPQILERKLTAKKDLFGIGFQTV